jgi:hypothetical protein
MHGGTLQTWGLNVMEGMEGQKAESSSLASAARLFVLSSLALCPSAVVSQELEKPP